ncbi:oligosaccharide biosynthesis protein Alg14 [Polaribacter reichenbachii]|uniref:Oligosaccharide biosynthesis protein Alg14 n=1 Tax=Polaribacter reichenbachii TaxID=996801 RepID=A0A1B8U3C2_9FLAO|nr:glycosyltransferase [Polaribacter reichenbachii]APZ46552.1 oligosaccharide biosynthesis protein Alg14 [Polaribacter reichenbachii]AUC17198.1 oligosaccharide biosynthesis protein Alg14 [Polaribacter reichenbachii]OBY66376.1 oligosaccharide biosynthesis protein Alg14 [Polaribacter reichenbachii]
MKKVVAISSIGGHWIQLLRLKPVFEDVQMVFITTKASFKSMVSESDTFYVIPDGNRTDKIGLLKAIKTLFVIYRKEKPDVIITTGAAPGLMGICVGKLLGIHTIWLDSIANCEELSMSGRIAKKIANTVYTQWEHLATNNVKYKGNVLK